LGITLMLWPFVLPLKLTLVVLAGMFLATLHVGKKRSWNAIPTFMLAVLAMPVLVIPVGFVVGSVVDCFRFGMFHYADFQEIHDFRIERYMPPVATNIDVYKHYSGNGYRARFRISQTDLDTWHQQFWDEHGEFSVANQSSVDEREPVSEDDFRRWFGDFEWEQPSDLLTYTSPIAGNGAHYKIWYSPSQERAFLTSCYW